MIGLIAIVVLLVLLTLATWAFARVFGIARRRGKSNLVSAVWGSVAVLVLSLPITWDAIPTWIAFEYYKKDAGITVFKTLEQWKLENPGVAETIEPYGTTYADSREEEFKLSNGVSRRPLNSRFSLDQGTVNPLLTVRIVRKDIVDVATYGAVVRWTMVGSGYGGGLYSGGEGWWKAWLNHRSLTDDQQQAFDKSQYDFRFLGSK